MVFGRIFKGCRSTSPVETMQPPNRQPTREVPKNTTNARRVEPPSPDSTESLPVDLPIPQNIAFREIPASIRHPRSPAQLDTLLNGNSVDRQAVLTLEVRFTLTEDNIQKLSNLPNLTRLDLGSSHTGPAEAALLSAVLPELLALKELDLSYNGHLGDEGIAYLSVPGVFREDLEKLNLCSCGIGADGAESLSAEGVLPRLKELNLSENVLNDEGVAFLSGPGVLPGESLEILNLSNNNIKAAGAESLSAPEALPQLLVLKRFDLSYNYIRKEGVASLLALDVLSKSMECLVLSHNRIGPSAEMSLLAKGALPKRMKLFDLQQNILGDELAAKVKRTLRTDNPDMRVNVDNNSRVPHNIYGLNIEDIIPGSEADINTTYSD